LMCANENYLNEMISLDLGGGDQLFFIH
jgi:hypothetical protein